MPSCCIPVRATSCWGVSKGTADAWRYAIYWCQIIAVNRVSPQSLTDISFWRLTRQLSFCNSNYSGYVQ
ncbi:hypothetical protein CWC46_08195 [Prodigiosinella confusarubida]|uniref:Uncharacterized protein n=1 Tax=Serratia sp. (strain ATCC 39006) TaxID=104623 RepID=A0A2I5T5G0_SERS3|nr:hypothetical protein CWC46_08195 [Serratia sp. ATCC 39006]AUH04123.1 hypothetical protein Ser39006_008200 [Serratia sp. ATCC 39006]